MTIEKERHDEIVKLLDLASASLEKARKMAGDDSYYWEGPGYGMGGWIMYGDWTSSNNC